MGSIVPLAAGRALCRVALQGILHQYFLVPLGCCRKIEPIILFATKSKRLQHGSVSSRLPRHEIEAKQQSEEE